jgi:hypothetical protein
LRRSLIQEAQRELGAESAAPPRPIQIFRHFLSDYPNQRYTAAFDSKEAVMVELGATGGAARQLGQSGNWEQERKKPGGSAQIPEKARFGEAKPRKSKFFPLILFGGAWPDFAQFG